MNKLLTLCAACALVCMPLLSACSDNEDSMEQTSRAQQSQETTGSATGQSPAPGVQEPDYDRRYPAAEGEDTARLSAGSEYKDKYGTLAEKEAARTRGAEPVEPEQLEETYPDASMPAFARLDTDGDGMLSPEEARENRIIDEFFVSYDTDKNGELDEDEYAQVKAGLAGND